MGTTFKISVITTESDSGKESRQCKRESGDSNRLIVGNSDNGGAANANWNHPDNSNDNIGFRVAVVLPCFGIHPATILARLALS